MDFIQPTQAFLICTSILNADRMNPMEEGVYRYTFSGECVFTEGMKYIPSDEVLEKVTAAKQWLPQPLLPFGTYKFFLTEKGKEHYEKTLKIVHESFLKDIQCEKVSIKNIGEVVYRDAFQIIAK